MKLIVKRLIKEGKVDEVVKIYEVMVAETRKEEGCIQYELCRDQKNPRQLMILEEWLNEEVLANHQKAAHFVKLVPVVNELTEEKSMETFDKLL